MIRLLCEWAWLGGSEVSENTLVTIDDGHIVTVEPNAESPLAPVEHLPGVTLPGLANVHSHAFHRALRARPDNTPTFWSWRDQMYRMAAKLDPDTYYELAKATFGEMVLAGITTVGEFHYLHHQAGGSPYADPNEMGYSLIRAAADSGIRLTLIDTCYLVGGLRGEELLDLQQRFTDGSAERWVKRVTEIKPGPGAKVAAAFHSVRALDEAGIATVAGWAEQRDAPLHAHVAEQPTEVEAALEVRGQTPVQIIEAAGALGPNFTAVHATHLDNHSIELLAGSNSAVCFCPTTERLLADGIGPSARLAAAGVDLSFGSDSNAIIDLFEEMRATEMHQRLNSHTRGHHPSAELLASASRRGHRSLGWTESGNIAPGAAADLITIDLSSVRMAGTRRPGMVDALVGSATSCDVSAVMVDGSWVVQDGRHLGFDVGAALDRAVAQVWS